MLADQMCKGKQCLVKLEPQRTGRTHNKGGSGLAHTTHTDSQQRHTQTTAGEGCARPPRPLRLGSAAAAAAALPQEQHGREDAGC